jgi:Tol biopolymer transport system component
MRFDFSTGKIIEKPKRLTNWSGFCMAGLTVSADGKRLTFLEWESHGTSYMTDLAAGGDQVLRFRRFPWSDKDIVLDWMPDSKAMILDSDRTGQTGIYKQPLDEGKDELIATGGGGRDLRMTPDGRSVLYFDSTGAPGETAPQPVMRLAFSGGPPQQLFIGKRHSFIVCARSPSSLCAIAEPTEDDKQVTITAIDPLHGRGPELARLDVDLHENSWWVELSPDGTRVAIIPSPTGPIYILSLRGQAMRQIHLRGWSDLMSLSWAADNKSLFVFSRSRQERALLHVDLQGNAHLLWENPGADGESAAIASPDGRHLAIWGWTLNSNMWTIENF